MICFKYRDIRIHNESKEYNYYPRDPFLLSNRFNATGSYFFILAPINLRFTNLGPQVIIYFSPVVTYYMSS